jgi:hypothetical protein
MKSTSLAILMLCWLMAGSAVAQKSCSHSITSCGCTITQPGNYIVDADLSALQGLTALKGCIDINVAHTKLFLNGHQMAGDPNNLTDIAIHVLPAGNYTFIEGNSPNATLPGGMGSIAVNDWLFGIESEADNVLMDLPTTTNNIVGVLLKGTYNNRLVGTGVGGYVYGASYNGAYGIWIVGGNSNQVDGAYSEYNGIAGIYVGCSATGPTGTPCPSGQASTGNVIYSYSSNSPGFSDTQPYGIALEVGSIRNSVANNGVSGDTRFDLYDGNANCADNLWRLNGFVKANQGCIH